MHTRLRKFLLLAVMSAALLLPAREASAALNAYVAKISGEKQGQIKGNTSVKGQDDWLSIADFSLGATSARDAASGLATGKRQHKPITLVLDVDLSIIAILIGMFEAGEKLDGTLAVTRKKKGKGGAQQYYEVKMTDALITSYRVESRPNGADVLVLEIMPMTIEGTLADGTKLFSSKAAAPVKKAAPASK